MQRHFASLVGICICWSLLSACSKQSTPQQTSNISGVLSYREAVNLDPDARIELQLSDVSVNSGPAAEVSNATIQHVHALPYSYSLEYDAGRIDPSHRYTMSARVYSNNQLRFATDSAIAVLTKGAGSTADIPVVATGINEDAVTTASSSGATTSDVFAGELRNGNEVTLYRAGFHDGHIEWLEEDRPNGTPQLLHARYEFKGALLLRYADGNGFEFTCSENGRPLSASKNRQTVDVKHAMVDINAARNRAALLRSHATASHEIKAHRVATKQDVSG